MEDYFIRVRPGAVGSQLAESGLWDAEYPSEEVLLGEDDPGGSKHSNGIACIIGFITYEWHMIKQGR